MNCSAIHRSNREEKHTIYLMTIATRSVNWESFYGRMRMLHYYSIYFGGKEVAWKLDTKNKDIYKNIIQGQVLKKWS